MPSEVRFADVRKVLEQHGWTLDRYHGSHAIFIKVGEPQHINLPVHGNKVKPRYIRQIEKNYGIRF